MVAAEPEMDEGEGNRQNETPNLLIRNFSGKHLHIGRSCSLATTTTLKKYLVQTCNLKAVRSARVLELSSQSVKDCLSDLQKAIYKFVTAQEQRHASRNTHRVYSVPCESTKSIRGFEAS